MGNKIKLEEICNCSADELEKMTDQQLLEWFKPMLDISRPERATAVAKKQEQKMVQSNPKLAAGLKLLEGLGVDSKGLLQPWKKGKR
jgi:hypothetical protein